MKPRRVDFGRKCPPFRLRDAGRDLRRATRERSRSRRGLALAGALSKDESMANPASVAARPVTADELLWMPDDGLRRELVDGEVRVMTPAGHPHGDIAMRIGWRLASHIEMQGLGKAYAAETAFRIASNPDTVLAPDVSFVGLERVQAAKGTEGPFPGAPDLALEVVSPR